MQITPIQYNNYNSKLNFTAYERTFVMLKPDAMNRKLDSAIMQKINDSGLKVLKQWDGVPTREQMEGNYISHKNKSFFPEWIDFLISGKIRALIVGGEDAVSKASNLKKDIRSEFAPGEKRFNLIHSSDDVESAKREISNFFDVKA